VSIIFFLSPSVISLELAAIRYNCTDHKVSIIFFLSPSVISLELAASNAM